MCSVHAGMAEAFATSGVCTLQSLLGVSRCSLDLVATGGTMAALVGWGNMGSAVHKGGGGLQLLGCFAVLSMGHFFACSLRGVSVTGYVAHFDGRLSTTTTTRLGQGHA